MAAQKKEALAAQKEREALAAKQKEEAMAAQREKEADLALAASKGAKRAGQQVPAHRNVAPEIVRFVSTGPASGWMVKGKAYQSGPQIFLKRPEAQVWESRHQALKDVEDEELRKAVDDLRAAVFQELKDGNLQASPKKKLRLSWSEVSSSTASSEVRALN
mmetsp:Transcript_10120/g.23484  ORF Transcript_10120/g.23484 Transcript_10120/m.23484 type:complete len:161 (+) Transcript_10120:2-484(+)